MVECAEYNGQVMPSLSHCEQTKNVLPFLAGANSPGEQNRRQKQVSTVSFNQTFLV